MLRAFPRLFDVFLVADAGEKVEVFDLIRDISDPEHPLSLEQLNIVQIESRELPADPMGAAPKLPFGHLNAAWKAFINGVGVDDEIWSFTAPWQTTRGSQEIRTGYAVVRGGVPGSHFLTMRKEVEDELLPL